jgi:hypothetical protein
MGPPKRKKEKMNNMQAYTPTLISTILFLIGLGAGGQTAAQIPQPGDPDRGKAFFLQNCAICHTTSLGPGNTVIVKQGPSLVGVVGRHAGSGLGFNYSQALSDSKIIWDLVSLNHFLASPMTAVPGTTMPIPIPDAGKRHDVIAYLSTLTVPAGISLTTSVVQVFPFQPENDPGAWQHAAPGVKHHITLADLPPPFRTASSGNNPQVLKQPANATLSVPVGFSIRLFAAGLSNPRLLRVAPNGDIFVAETGANRIRVLRAAAGADAPSENQIFAEGLDRPFGIAFYP